MQFITVCLLLQSLPLNNNSTDNAHLTEYFKTETKRMNEKMTIFVMSKSQQFYDNRNFEL